MLSLAAVVADKRGDFATAIEHQEAAMLIEPSVIALQASLADYYVKAGRLAAARMVYEKIVESPIATAAEKQRAAALLRASLPVKGREAFVRGLEADSISAVAPLLRSLVARSVVQGDSEAHAHTRSQAAGEVVQAHEALVERCWMRTAAALSETLPKAMRDDNPYLLFAAARVARFFGEEPEVERLLRRIIELTPKDAKGSGELHMRALCMQRRYHEAFAQARRDAAAAERAPSQLVTMFKLEHDAAQLRYLAGKGRLRDRGNIDDVVMNFEAGAQQIAAACKTQPGAAAKTAGVEQQPDYLPECDPFAHEGGYGAMRPRTRKVVQRELNAPRYSLPFVEWTDRPALNFACCDWEALENSYRAGRVVVIDDFLTPDALAELLRLGLESTNWNSVKAGGYLGAFAKDGFAPPVVAQLALDLEEAMSRVLRAHSLLMFWGFKHDTVRTRAYHGIKAHADTAAVNLNFWVTPDAANLDPSSGGLIVYERVSAIESFKDIGAYNNYALGAQDLGLDSSRMRKVAYRQNRAVLFTSALFHATDTVDFKPGYENCRMLRGSNSHLNSLRKLTLDLLPQASGPRTSEQGSTTRCYLASWTPCAALSLTATVGASRRSRRLSPLPCRRVSPSAPTE